jgi:hypothetical protein
MTSSSTTHSFASASPPATAYLISAKSAVASPEAVACLVNQFYGLIYNAAIADGVSAEDADKTAHDIACQAGAIFQDICSAAAAARTNGACKMNAILAALHVAEVYLNAFFATRNTGVSLQEACNAASIAAHAANTVYRVVYDYVLAAMESSLVLDDAIIDTACNAAACVSRICGVRYTISRANGACKMTAILAALHVAEVYRNVFVTTKKHGVSVEVACRLAKSACDSVNVVYRSTYSHVLAAATVDGVLDDATINAACNTVALVSGICAARYADLCAYGVSKENANFAAYMFAAVYCTAFVATKNTGVSVQEAFNVAYIIVHAANAIYRYVFDYVLAVSTADGVLDDATINVSCNIAACVSVVCSARFAVAYICRTSVDNANLAADTLATV